MIATLLLKLSCFTGEATRFTESERETEHKFDHGLRHRPKVEVLKGSLSAHTTTGKYYYDSYCSRVLSAGFINFLGSSKRQIAFSQWLIVAYTQTILMY